MAEPGPSEATSEPTLELTGVTLREKLTDVDLDHRRLYQESKDRNADSGFIDEQKGHGIVTHKLAPRGCIIFDDLAVVLDEAAQFGSWKGYDLWVANQLRGCTSNVARVFFNIPAPHEETKGKFAARFDYGSHRVQHKGRDLKVFSPKLYLLNHACVPNAHLQVLPGHTTSNFRTVLCRANRDIEEGEEITIAYGYYPGTVEDRQQLVLEEFGFHCACNHCINPQPCVENGFKYIDELVSDQLEEPHILDRKPAKALKYAYRTLKALLHAGVSDVRVGKVLECCAQLCAYHSDAGRVLYFATLAWAVYSIVENDSDTALLERVAHEPDKMPGWGMTRRGLSFEEDSKFLEKLEERNDHRVLDAVFMLNMPDHKYLRLSRVHEDHDSEPEDFEVEDLMEGLRLEKKEYDEERHQHDGPSITKAKGKDPEKRGLERREEVEGDAEPATEGERETKDRPDIRAEMGRLLGMRGKSASLMGGKNRIVSGKKKGKGKGK